MGMETVSEPVTENVIEEEDEAKKTYRFFLIL